MTVTSERIWLDPAEITATRQEIDITPWIDMEGIDWGEATIEPVMAERNRGEVPVDFRVPNREISVPLNFVARGGTTAVEARSLVQAKARLFQWEGGWIKRLTNSGGTVFADVVNASFNATSISGVESVKEYDLEAQLTLEVLPDFYEAERTLGDHTETTAAELVFTETGIDGDYPARVRIVVDDDQAIDQRGLLWGFRNRHYSSASTAALKYEAEALTAMDTATKPALTGASGGTVVRHGTVSTNWTPVMNTNLAAGTYLTHTGTYRLWGRCYSTSGTAVQSRAVWDVGDLVNPVENDAIQMPGASNFFMQDYGEIRLDPAPVGTHRWQGQIQARGAAGSENFSVDKLWMAPVDEGYGKLTAPVNFPEGVTAAVSRSEFRTEAGTITGDTMAVGGVWVGAGDANDFVESSDTATRTAVSDASTGIETGRIATATTPSTTNVIVQADIRTSANAGSGPRLGVVARYTNVSNFFVAYVDARLPDVYGALVLLISRVAGVSTTSIFAPGFVIDSNAWYTMRLYVDSAGRVSVWVVPQGGSFDTPQVTTQMASLATGGGLASGTNGLFDWHVDAFATNRDYDNFSVVVPPADAVMFASQSAQLTTDGIVREDSTGTSYGPVSIRTGDNPRLPVAGLEARTTEVFIKASRGEFDRFPDSHTASQYGDDISARIFYRPSWLHVPDN